MSLSRLVHHVAYNLKTLYLFTKADIKVCILPIACLAAACAPLASASRLIHVVFWIWLECLELALSNQTLNPDEDAQNKPDRPIPSGRISLHTAKRLRWIVPIFCWLWSASYGRMLMDCSIATSMIILLYDEMGLAGGHWLNRNIMNSLGHACVQVGACILAGGKMNGLNPIATLSIACSAGVILFTIHAQDFKDILGDTQVGRTTIPIVYPQIARPTLMIAIVAWSMFLTVFWGLHAIAGIAFLVFGTVVGWRFVTKTSKKDDAESLSIYMLWLSTAQMLPAYYRCFHATTY